MTTLFNTTAETDITSPAYEEARLNALYEYELLDKPQEGVFTHISKLACELLGTFDAGIALVDRDRICFNSSVVKRAVDIPRENAFASYAIMEDKPFIVSDVFQDERFRDSPAVRGVYPDGAVTSRFFAGIPLTGMAGYRIGTFGVVDLVPRVLSDLQIGVLKAFAKMIVYELDLRLSQRRILNLKLDEARRREDQEQQFLSEKLASVGRLTAGIAHEINTPMQFVSSNTEFVRDGVKNLTSALQQILKMPMVLADGAAPWGESATARALVQQLDLDFLLSEMPVAMSQTQGGIERVNEMISALKLFSHTQSDGRTKVCLNAAIRATVTITRNSWKTNSELDLVLDEALPQVRCNVGEINQVILNLLVNAAQAIDERLDRTSGERGKISIRSFQDDEDVVIELEDNGGGIPAENLKRIFDPFFTTKRVGQGTGQGLSISYDIVVRKHGGKLEVRSQPEKLSTVFRVCLPVDGSEKSPREEG